MNSLYIAFNMLRRTLLQKKGFLMYLIIPVAALSLVIGILGQSDTHAVTIEYRNEDQGAMGARVIEELSALPDYRLKEAASEQSLKDRVIGQKVDVSFYIPANFSETMLAGEMAEVDMYHFRVSEASFTLKINLDGILSRFQQTVQLNQSAGLQGKALQDAVDKVLDQTEKRQIQAKLTDFNLYVNPGMNAVIGFMLMFMMGLINNTVTVMMDDRRQRTMARIYAAPVRSLEIVLGNFLGSFLVGTLQVLGVLTLTELITHYHYGLPFWSHFIILEFFLLASMGIACTIAGLVKQATNVSIINSLVITPTCMLGGCFWPISFMPEWMQRIANFVPQKWVIDAIVRMASGETLSAMWLHMGVLTLFALVLMGVGSVVLKPGEAEAG